MRRHRLLVIVLGLLLAISLTAVALESRADQGPAYSVAALRAHLERDPRGWTNRSLRVRARVLDCVRWLGGVGTPCLDPGPSLADGDAPATTVPLPLATRPASPLLAFLRRLPLVGGVVPAAQSPRWGEVAVYRIELRRADAVCGDAVCYEAVLPDADPEPPWGWEEMRHDLRMAS